MMEDYVEVDPGLEAEMDITYTNGWWQRFFTSFADFIRAIVRPVLTVGTPLLAVAVQRGLPAEEAEIIVAPLLGAWAVMVGFWFNDRAKNGD